MYWLDMNLRVHIAPSLRSVAVESIWGPKKEELANTRDTKQFFDLYFKYYAQQCDLIGRHANGKYSSIKTHGDIMDVARLLRQNLPREDVRKHMSDFLETAHETQHESSINLVARLIFMIKIGNIPHECLGGRALDWNCGGLVEFIHNHFSCPPTRGHERIKLERSFNARNLERIAGIEIWWTDNLADHLSLMNDDKVIAIFHHASFLEYQKHHEIFPPGFIEETQRTIALLFPKYDRATKKWYQKIASKSTQYLDMQLIGTGNLNAEARQIGNFGYWHDRLVILKEVYDEARPNTLSQFWCDRRNGVQWYTFWVAVGVVLLTVVFGFVQCIEGGLQVYKAFHP